MVTTEFAPIGPHNDPVLRNLTKPQPQPEPRKTVDLCAPTGQHHNLCANNLGIPRYNMPQMPGDPTKINEILDNLKSNHNITHTQTENMENLLIRNLKPSQKEVNEGKAMGIARAMTMNVFPNGYIFISNDGYIIDGHHRWFAYMIADRTDGMGVIQINAPIARILQLLSAETRDTPTLSMNDTPWRLLPV